MRLPGSLRARIVLAAVAAVGICGLLAGALLLAAVERDGRNQVDADLRARADSILRRPGDAYGRGRDRGETLLRGSGTFAQVAYGDNQHVAAQTIRGDFPAPSQRDRRLYGCGVFGVLVNGHGWSPSVWRRLQAAAPMSMVKARTDRHE